MRLLHAREKTWPALLTGTITPHPHAISKLNDSSEREEQYLETLRWMATGRTGIKKIFFCENSGYDLVKFHPLYDLYAKHNRQLSLYSVPAPPVSNRFPGKGWAEGIMISWALENCMIKEDIKAFIKITGRYRVLNLKRIVTVIRRELRRTPSLKFVGYSFTTLPRLHIRSDFFWSDKDFYTTYLADAYTDVDDANGHYLEHAFAERLWRLKDRFDIGILSLSPLIRGISGWNAKRMLDTRQYLKEEVKQALRPLPRMRKIKDLEITSFNRDKGDSL